MGIGLLGCVLSGPVGIGIMATSGGLGLCTNKITLWNDKSEVTKILK